MPPRPDRPKSKNLAPLKRASVFLKPYTKTIFFAFLALLITSGAVLGLGTGLRFLVDQGIGQGDGAFLDRALWGMLGVVLLFSLGTYARFYMVTWLGEKVVADIRNAVYAQVLKLSPGFFEVTKTGEILSRLTTDTTLLQTVIGSSVSLALRNILMLIGGVIMLVVTNAKLAGLVALVVPVVVIPIIVYGRKVRQLSRDSQDKVAGVGAFAEESLNGIRTVQAFGHEQQDRQRFDGEVQEAFKTAINRTRARASLSAIVIFLVFGAIGIILWAGGHDVLEGEITPGELSAFLFYAVIVAASTGAVSEVFGDLQRAAGATERLMELLETQPEISAPEKPSPLPVPTQGAVTFSDVDFLYPSRPDYKALGGFSLDVKPGETLALVGPSGAGKSTIFQLILRFYDPNKGTVCFDGVDLRDVDPEVVRRHIGLVPQDPVIFAANAMENIRYGKPEASDEEVRAAADAAAALEFIEKLPQGFQSFLGEKGVRLSGGQKQRIAIARALLRDPELLLLDEATSALDAESEKLVQGALDKLMKGRTTLIIAHRLATVVNADRIAVIDEGRLIATGPHDQLIETNPLYARLAKLQFSAKNEVLVAE